MNGKRYCLPEILWSFNENLIEPEENFFSPVFQGIEFSILTKRRIVALSHVHIPLHFRYKSKVTKYENRRVRKAKQWHKYRIVWLTFLSTCFIATKLKAREYKAYLMLAFWVISVREYPLSLLILKWTKKGYKITAWNIFMQSCLG